MARRGALVTGIDLGPAAIATAKRRAHKAGLAVEFVQGDVRAMEYEAVFDAVTFIFGCFTEMPRHDAEEVLRHISRSLRPDGIFVLDVYAPRFFAALDGEQEWWVGHDFIAGRFPQLVLTEYFYYAREKTYARRDFICDARTGAIHTFGVSGQAYALPALCGMIEAAGLSPTMVYSGWQGEEATSDSQMYVVLAAKRPSPDVGAFVLANNTPHIDQQLRFRRFGAIGHGHDRQRHISLFASSLSRSWCASLRDSRSNRPARGLSLRRSAWRGADSARPAWQSLVFAGFTYCTGGGWIPARIQIERASIMRGWFMRNRTIVALPVGVKPRRTCPLCIHSKCSDQLWILGLNRGRSCRFPDREQK
jgi:hypothetical protein